jgi:hypothetical protein
LKDVPVTLTVDGHEIETGRATVAPHASSSISFTQFTLASPSVAGWSRPARIRCPPTTPSSSR